MKLIRYIRPTSRRTKAQQLASTEREGIAFTVVEGEDGCDWSTALKLLKKGNGLLIDMPEILGRRIETRCARVRDTANKGAWIVLANHGEHAPDKAESLIAWMQAGGDRSPKPRVAHNKTPDDALLDARKLWTQQQYKRMTNGEVAAVVGLSIPTLTRSFGPRSNYIETKAGRPKRRK